MALPSGEQVDRQVVDEALDCAGGRSRSRGTELYVADTVVATAPAVPAWTAVAPERRPVFDATCAFVRGGFADRLRARRQDEDMPELANRDVVGRALRREYGALRTMGTVDVRFRVREDGTVDAGSMAVVDYTQPELAEPARRVAMEMRFKPARGALAGAGVGDASHHLPARILSAHGPRPPV